MQVKIVDLKQIYIPCLLRTLKNDSKIINKKQTNWKKQKDWEMGHENRSDFNEFLKLMIASWQQLQSRSNSLENEPMSVKWSRVGGNSEHMKEKNGGIIYGSENRII